MKVFKFSIYFKVKGYKEMRLDYIEADSMLNALLKFQNERPFAIPQSITRNKN